MTDDEIAFLRTFTNTKGEIGYKPDGRDENRALIDRAMAEGYLVFDRYLDRSPMEDPRARCEIYRWAPRPAGSPSAYLIGDTIVVNTPMMAALRAMAT